MSKFGNSAIPMQPFLKKIQVHSPIHKIQFSTDKCANKAKCTETSAALRNKLCQTAQMGDSKGVPRILRHWRKIKKLSQEDLAALSGVGRRTIQDIERGINRPSMATLDALAGALKIPFTEFFRDGEGDHYAIPAEFADDKDLAKAFADRQINPTRKVNVTVDFSGDVRRNALSPSVISGPLSAADAALILGELSEISPDRRAVTLAILFDDSSLAPEDLDLNTLLPSLSKPG